MLGTSNNLTARTSFAKKKTLKSNYFRDSKTVAKNFVFVYIVYVYSSRYF